MEYVIADSELARRIIRRRRRLGIDAHDEVWDGVYLMSPQPNIEHQELAFRLTLAFFQAIDAVGLGRALCGVSLSDRARGWTKNYRTPDVSVFLMGNPAKALKTHWQGGPDFAVEVLSKDDQARKKFDFYASIGTRELLLVDRQPWALELYRLDGGVLRLVAKSTLDDPMVLASGVLPLRFRLVAGEDRPLIRIEHDDGVQAWSA